MFLGRRVLGHELLCKMRQTKLMGVLRDLGGFWTGIIGGGPANWARVFFCTICCTDDRGIDELSSRDCHLGLPVCVFSGGSGYVLSQVLCLEI
jgi:hypothetical protein